MHRRVIIVFGISGVGKTTACRAFVTQNPNFVHLQASQLLKEATGKSSEELRTAEPSAVERNQSRLSKIINDKVLASNRTDFILDAHSIIDNGRQLIEVPTHDIESLQPTGFVFLEDDPEAIQRRRSNDVRDRPFRTASELLSQQNLAKSVVEKYAASLRIPLAIGHISENNDLSIMIKAITG